MAKLTHGKIADGAADLRAESRVGLLANRFSGVKTSSRAQAMVSEVFHDKCSQSSMKGVMAICFTYKLCSATDQGGHALFRKVLGLEGSSPSSSSPKVRKPVGKDPCWNDCLRAACQTKYRFGQVCDDETKSTIANAAWSMLHSEKIAVRDAEMAASVAMGEAVFKREAKEVIMKWWQNENSKEKSKKRKAEPAEQTDARSPADR